MRIRRWKTVYLALLLSAGAPQVLAKSAASHARPPAEERLEPAAFYAAYREDCQAFARRARCDLSGDLDGDGKLDRAFKIRARKGGVVGIAVAWANGSFSVLGAGARTPHLRTEVFVDGTEESVRVDPLDLHGILTWRLLRPVRDGFAAFSAPGRSKYAAPSVVGPGIYFSGGDAAEMLYWDGHAWRWLILGF